MSDSDNTHPETAHAALVYNELALYSYKKKTKESK